MTLDRFSMDIGKLSEYDIVVDTVAGDDIGEFINLLGLNGRYVFCGGVAGAPPVDFGAHLVSAFHKSPTFCEFSLNSIAPNDLMIAMSDLFGQAARGEIIGVVDDVLSLEHAADAHRKLESGGVFGKLVLTASREHIHLDEK